MRSSGIVLVLSCFVASGCALTTSAIYEQHSVQLKDSSKLTPFALIEARSFKTMDSTPELLSHALKRASKIGAAEITCAGLAPGLAPAAVPSPADIKALSELAEAVTKLFKHLVALPVTIRSEAISDKTLSCVAYRP